MSKDDHKKASISPAIKKEIAAIKALPEFSTVQDKDKAMLAAVAQLAHEHLAEIVQSVPEDERLMLSTDKPLPKKDRDTLEAQAKFAMGDFLAQPFLTQTPTDSEKGVAKATFEYGDAVKAFQAQEIEKLKNDQISDADQQAIIKAMDKQIDSKHQSLIHEAGLTLLKDVKLAIQKPGDAGISLPNTPMDNTVTTGKGK